MSAGERVRGLIEPLLGEQGLEVVDVEHSGATRRITVDRVDGGGIGLEPVASASEVVSAALDRDGPIPGRYTLEGSRPGVERRLRTPAGSLRPTGSTVAGHPRPP